MGGSRGAPQRSASPRVSQQSKAGSIKNVRPPPIIHYPNSRLGTKTHQQCCRGGKSRKGNRFRLPRVSVNGIYDTNDPQSYVSPVRRRWAVSQVDELWDRWRAVEVKKRRRTWELLTCCTTSSIHLLNNLVMREGTRGSQQTGHKSVLVEFKLWGVRIIGKG